MRHAPVGLLLGLLAALTAHATPPLDLPDSVPQGGLVVGRVPPGSRVQVNGHALRVAEEGWVTFGVGRDTAEVQVVTVTLPDGRRALHRIEVQPRPWRIERVDGLPPATVTPDPQTQARIAREQARVAEARRRDDARTDFLQPFIWPVQGRVSGVYGSQRILNGEPRNPHYGLDVAVPTGMPIRAPAAGIVTFADPDLFLTGGTLVLDHGHGVSSTFIHLSRLDRRVGERVEQGDVIGAVGATGRATGPHMHWGMNWFEVRLDPQLLLPPPP